MFQSTFHVNTFKPWNPHSTKYPQSYNVHKTLNPVTAQNIAKDGSELYSYLKLVVATR